MKRSDAEEEVLPFGFNGDNQKKESALSERVSGGVSGAVAYFVGLKQKESEESNAYSDNINPAPQLPDYQKHYKNNVARLLAHHNGSQVVDQWNLSDHEKGVMEDAGRTQDVQMSSKFKNSRPKFISFESKVGDLLAMVTLSPDVAMENKSLTALCDQCRSGRPLKLAQAISALEVVIGMIQETNPDFCIGLELNKFGNEEQKKVVDLVSCELKGNNHKYPLSISEARSLPKLSSSPML